MKLSNDHHKLYIKVDKKFFEVKHVVTSQSEANTLCAKDPSIAVIDKDDKKLIYLASIIPA